MLHIKPIFWLALLLAVTLKGTAQGVEDEAAQWVQFPLTVSKEVRDRVVALPPVEVIPGFKSQALVAPGSALYDPFDIHVLRDNSLLVADDAHGGALYTVTMDGDVSRTAVSGQHPPISLDVAPASFGDHEAYIYTVAFAVPKKIGGWGLPNAVTRFHPQSFKEEVVCFLPPNADGKAGAGSFFARFGPEGSAFEGKLYVTAASNHTLYTVSPSGECQALATLDIDRWGSPRGISFTQDHQFMLVGAAIQDSENPAITHAGKGRVLMISADGAVAEEPFVTGLHEPGAMAFAPEGFGAFAGDLFISDAGNWDNDIKATEPIASDGKVYRIGMDGKLELFMSGLANPVAVDFVGTSLIVTDINGDFHVGQHKIPIGFIMKVDPAP